MSYGILSNNGRCLASKMEKIKGSLTYVSRHIKKRQKDAEKAAKEASVGALAQKTQAQE